MQSKILMLMLLALSAGLFGCEAGPGNAGGQGEPAAALETDEDRILYVLGFVLGQNVEPAGLSEAETAAVVQGLRDGALGRDPEVDLQQYGPQLQAFMQQRMDAAAAVELESAMAFLEEQAALEGATRTESGMVVQELTPGSGEQPDADSMVVVHYHGTLRDGTVFDSSVDRGQPATFGLDRVIPCWTEGVQTMRVGGTSRFVCPPELAYGPSGTPGIPGNSVLVFEVELLEIIEE